MKPRKRKSPEDVRQRKSKLKAIGIMAFSLVIVVFVAGVLINKELNTPTLDDETMCPLTSGPTAYWAVLVDVTDTYSRIDQVWIEKQFDAIQDSIPIHGLLSVFAISDKPVDALKPLIARCNPGSGEGRSFLADNPALLNKRWEAEFIQPLDHILDSLVTNGGRMSSPIMESIKAVNTASMSLGRIDRRIFLFSDMMEHTGNYSHYQNRPPTFSAFENSVHYRRVAADLRDWNITIYYALREDAVQVQGTHHIIFWEDYISMLNGKIDRVRTIGT